MAEAGVDEYLAALPAGQRAALNEVRKTVSSVAPDATEVISYKMPAFKYQGRMLVWYAAFKDHLSLFPASEKVLEELGEALKPYFSGKGTIRFTMEDPLPTALVKKIVKTRIAENQAATGRRKG
jgi:uncharacterized protein YdhG (YjbR/CyaY superfamily)